MEIEVLLRDKGIETDQLMPKEELSSKLYLPPPVTASVT